MKIMACNNINSKTVRLEYTSSKDKPKRTPIYTIDADIADEFVKKYNQQTARMANITACTTILTSIIGFVSGLKKHKILPVIIKTIAGAAAGFTISSYCAYKQNKKLMDKYNVRAYKTQNNI